MFQDNIQIDPPIVSPENGVSIDTKTQAQTESMSKDRVQSTRIIPLPPVPTRIQIPKPTVGIDTANTDLSLLTSSTELSKPVFKFKVSDEAATFNMKLLRDNNFELGRLFNQTKSVTSYGSEFKSPTKLEPLLQSHPRWTELKRKLIEGAIFPVTTIDEKVRVLDLEAMRLRGNHKSAQTR